MNITIGLIFGQTPALLGVQGVPPETVELPLGAVPQAGDVLGFAGLRLADGRAAAFRVARRFVEFAADNRLLRTNVLLELQPDPSFVGR